MGRNVSLNILQQRTRICHILTMLVLIVAALAVSNDHTQAQAPVDAVTTDTSITLSWTADGEVHFFWYQPKTKQIQVISVTDGKSHTITGLAPKSVHKFSFFGAFFGTLVVTTNADSNPPPPPPPPTPEVSIAAGSDITEGGTASFTLTANPAPTASITVSVSPAESGDYGVGSTAKTVTIGTSGTATISFSTTNDNIDEADGSVTATVDSGSGYTVSSSKGSATLAVADNDVPELSIASDSNVTEGSAASFTISASPTPHSALTASVDVLATGSFGVTAGAQTVTIPTSGSKSFTVSTSGDTTDEPDGTVTATLSSGSGYTMSSSAGTASATVSDDDDPPPPAADPVVSIAAGSDITEGSDASFTVTITPEPSEKMTVHVTVTQSGDFLPKDRRNVLIYVVFSMSSPHTFTVATTDDSTEEPDGSFTATITDREGYTVSTTKGVATVKVSDNDDPSPPPAKEQQTTLEVIDNCVTDSLLSTVRHYYDVNKDRSPGFGKNWKRVLLAFGDVSDSELTAFTAAEAQDGESRWYGWTPVREALDCIEDATEQQPPPPPPPADPEISISSSSDVSEGGTVTFTVTATPAPTTDLSVSVSVTQSGSYTSQAGVRSVTITSTGTASFTVTTLDDSTDEPDGSVTATVNTGTGYTVSSSAGSTTANVADNDDPPLPEISISGGSAVAEGGNVSFTVTATPAPTADLSVSVSVTQSGSFTSQAGVRSVTITSTGTASFTVTTLDDSTDEPDGSVTATVNTGTGYTVSSSAGSTTANVADNDDPPLPEISISGGSAVAEGGNVSFTVTATPAPTADLSVSVSVAQSGSYTSQAGVRTVTITSTGTASFTVTTLDDSTDEPDGSVTATVNTGTGYTVSTSANAATVAVSDDDEPPPTPEISIAGSADVSEGGNATFTLTSTPAPTADVDVSVTITQSGGYTSQAGSMTVTVSDTGTASFVIGTDDDTTYEDDGSVTATIDAGTGYDVSSTSGAATVAVSDDDDWMTAPQRQQITDCVSFDILNLAIHYYDLNKGNWPDYGKNWRRVLVTFGRVQDPELTPLTGAEALKEEAIWSGWKPIREAIECIEAASPPPPPVAIPEVSITKGSDITEGGKATFTLTATPKQSAEFYVSLTVTQSGTFSSATGTRNVTIDESGTAVLEFATDDDSTDEPDGNIAVTLNTGVAYTLASTTTASVNVTDNDDPPAPRTTGTPTIDIADAAAVEGQAMSFTVSVSPTHTSDITVDYQTVNGTAISHPDVDDYTHASGTLTIPAGQSSATFAVQTTADNNNEIEDQFTVEISTTTSGIVVGDGTATGTINNDDVGNVGNQRSYGGARHFSLLTVNMVMGNGFDGDFSWRFRPQEQPPTTITVRPFLKSATNAPVVTLKEQYLVFNTTNWKTDQKLHLHLAQDFDSENDLFDIGYDIVEFKGETFSHFSRFSNGDIWWGQIVEEKPDSTPLVEGDGNSSAVYRLKLQHGPIKPVVVTFTNPDPGAVQLSTTSLTFTSEDYDQFQQVTITPVADDDVDDEQVEVTVDIPVPGPKGDKTETFSVTVEDDGVAPQALQQSTPTITIADASANEGDAMTFTVSVSPTHTSDITVDYETVDGTAISHPDVNDYTAVSGSVTIDANTSSATFVVNTTVDDHTEIDDQFTVVLSTTQTDVMIENSIATGTIVNDDTGTAGDVLWQCLEKDKDTGECLRRRLLLNVGDTYLANIGKDMNDQDTSYFASSIVMEDYYEPHEFGMYLRRKPDTTLTIMPIIANPLLVPFVPITPRYLVFTPENYSVPQKVSLHMLPDFNTAHERSDLTVRVIEHPNASVYGLYKQQNLWFFDRRRKPIEQERPATSVLHESDSTSSLTYRLRLGARPMVGDDIEVTVTASPDKVNLSPATLTYTHDTWDQWQEVTITPKVDADSVDEEVTVTVHIPVPGPNGPDPKHGPRIETFSLTVLDDDVAPLLAEQAMPTISIADASANEGEAMTFTVSVSPTHTSDITVDYETVDGTAISHPDVNDYTAASGTVTILAGKSSATITVQTTEDTDIEIDDQFTVNLSNPSVGAIGDGTAIGTITNDDSGETGKQAWTTVDGKRLRYIPTLSRGDGKQIVSQSMMELSESTKWSVRLRHQPTTTVTIVPYLKNEQDILVATLPEQYLVFNTENWATYQKFSIKVAPDFNGVSGKIVVDYDIIEFDDELVNDVGWIAVLDQVSGRIVQEKPNTTAMHEGDTTASVTYRLKLVDVPLEPIIVTLTNPDPYAVQLSATTLTFTPENYDQFQEVTISPVTDGDGDDEQVKITVNIPVPGLKGGKTETFTVTVQDDDFAP